jgi:transposase
MSRRLRGSGFAEHIVDPRRVKLIASDPRKNDKRDAETLARLEAGMPELLGNVHHRGEQAQADLSIIRARDGLVRTRTLLIQQVRGMSKASGYRLPSVSADSFDKRVRDSIPEALRPALSMLLDHIGDTTKRIREADALLARAVEERYPAAARLAEQFHGVGPVTSAAFVLSIEDPKRFESSRKVGSWAGLCPRSFASGDSNPELGISKAGNAYLRRLLLQCAHYIIGPFGQDSDLRRFGHRLVARGGRAARKRAVVAVARKLAVVMHHVWRNGVDFNPLHNAERQASRESA